MCKNVGTPICNIQPFKVLNIITEGCDYLVALESARGAFDIILLDPPYRFDYGEKALQKISQKGLLSENGIAVYERDRPFVGEIDGLEKYDERKYGKTYLTFFKRS